MNLISLQIRQLSACERMPLTKSLTALVLLFAFAKAVPFRRTDLEVNGNAEREINYHLPSRITPIHYNIKMIPYLVEGNFDGESSIDLEIQRPTTKISLHSKNLTIKEEMTYLKYQHPVHNTSIHMSTHEIFLWPIKHGYESKSEILTIDFGNILQPGFYNLNLGFVGYLNDDLTGFYRTSYTNYLGETIWLAVTHFETINARQAFPCLDEPKLKATFNISIKHYDNYTAISNMPIRERSTVEEDGKIWTHFEKTPVMSTYLVAFTLLNGYNRISNANENINVWCRQEVIYHVRFFFEAVQRATMELKEYLNDTVRVPKIDHVVVPQHARAAMENWGLIIYKESKILYEEDFDSVEVKGAVAMIPSHELSHQWFGNLISPSFWTHVWLNEGLATYLQYLIPDKIFPDLQLLNYFTISTLQTAFLSDPGERQLNHNVSTPQEIRSVFSPITYLKSSSILRMLSHCISNDVFRRGLIEYIQQYQYKVASPKDLWKSLQKALDSSSISHFDITEAMTGWIEQKGYPLVEVERNYTTGEIKFTQRQFIQRNDNGSDENIGSNKWWIPLTFTTGARSNFVSTLPTYWLSPYAEYLTLNGIDPSDLIIVNLQQTGFYRVNYDTNNWLRIIKFLNSGQFMKIHVVNRAQILNDVYHLVKSNQIGLTIFLELTNYLERETDLIPWYTALEILRHVEPYLKCPELGKLVKPHLLRLMRNLINTTGLDEHHDDDHLTKLKRSKILNIICDLGHIDGRKTATTKLTARLEDPVNYKVPSYLYHFTYCIGMRKANETTWNKMLDMYLNRVRERTLLYLTCTENPTIISNLLNMTMNKDTPISRKDSVQVYRYLLRGDYEKIDATLNFIIVNWNDISSHYTEVDTYEVLFAMTESVASMEQVEKMKAFLVNIRHKEFLPDLIEAETLLTKVARYTAEVRNWLEGGKSDFSRESSRS